MTAAPRIAFVAGLAVLALAVAVVLSHSPLVLARSNAAHPVNVTLGSVPGGGSACQQHETLPAGVSVIGVSLFASAGPRVAITVLSGGKVLTSGQSAAGWIGKVVAIPVRPLRRAAHDVTVCVSFTGGEERVTFLGLLAPRERAASSEAGVLGGRMTIEYLRGGSSSWWSLALSVARRMGLGRAWPGSWVALLVGALMTACIAVGFWLTLRETR